MRFTDGTELKRFESFSLSERFLDPVDRMQVRLRPGLDELARYLDLTQKGELIGLSVDDHAQAAMMIESRTVTVSPGEGYVIDLQCVATIKILLEGYVEAKDSKRLDADEPIMDFVDSVVVKFGFKEIQADSDIAAIKTKTGRDSGAQSKQPKTKMHKGAQTSGSETAYAFINRVLSRNGLMLRQHPEGTLILTAPHYDGGALYCVRHVADGGPVGDWVMGQFGFSETNDGQFSFVSTNGVPRDDDGETETASPTERVESSAINSQRPPFRSTGFINYKPCFIVDDNSKDAKHAKHVSTLVLGKAAERAFQLRVTVPSLVSREGIPWTVDTMCRVYLPVIGLDEEMWIAERTMAQDTQGGQRTELVLVPRGYVMVGEA
jgi:hypothetical protein